MKIRVLIIIGITLIVFLVFVIFIIPELWLEYFSYPNVDANTVCKMNGGLWNRTGNYCDGIVDICERVGGTRVSWNISAECESEITGTQLIRDLWCSDIGLVHIACKFP